MRSLLFSLLVVLSTSLQAMCFDAEGDDLSLKGTVGKEVLAHVWYEKMSGWMFELDSPVCFIDDGKGTSVNKIVIAPSGPIDRDSEAYLVIGKRYDISGGTLKLERSIDNVEIVIIFVTWEML
jgi:hypothetical protein